MASQAPSTTAPRIPDGDSSVRAPRETAFDVLRARLIARRPEVLTSRDVTRR
ncbi:hypothetical protein GCM10023145_07790 [Angustibacter luteus]